ncbi:hypothetical protein COT97_04210 [Candidatus Falkowbacteria bacterium CG10_big_fil_rev_8_21_14_0_10_39_11]|uniref:Cyclic-phosphate processing Receiver domain-containing protein n=1 Tax=Candidatus Falkowbacteria bacterium CG10_big_fil_rev_8_21_14_0_10_39_11 TaxID=1974565 RepID=A0A2H0V4B7_9BACT|nr:MAG: hypothetical protein COT97_04210 [Candidatus Falkowbacteria bacterium CG10_big_fil_rev_8_21_14_0_10_39_11]
MKIFLDDVRKPPVGWLLVRTPAEVIEMLKTGTVDELSLDHDIALWDDQGDEIKGTAVTDWLEEQYFLLSRGEDCDVNFPPPRVLKVHSDNCVGKPSMLAAIRNIRRFWELAQS